MVADIKRVGVILPFYGTHLSVEIIVFHVSGWFILLLMPCTFCADKQRILVSEICRYGSLSITSSLLKS